MRLLKRLFGAPDRGTAPALYAEIVAIGRQPHWYREGAAPDTIDGRFDVIAAVLSMVLLRLEQDEAGVPQSTALTEVFIDDMDGQLREIGIGDVVVGKHLGRMVGMLGGRLGAYRDGIEAGSIQDALVRNLYRGEAPAPAALTHVEQELMQFRETLGRTPITTLVAGSLAA